MIVDITFWSAAATMSVAKPAHMESYTLYKQTFILESVQASYSGQEYDIVCQTAVTVGTLVSHPPYILAQPMELEASGSATISVCK